MIAEAKDFLDESEALHRLVSPLNEDELHAPTAFKAWSIERVIRHLHMWNWGANLAMVDEPAFLAWISKVMAGLQSGDLGEIEANWADGLTGPALVEAWIGFAREMTPRFAEADPKLRVKWAGPDMSVRSSITARLMETWAHGQEVYDELGLVRKNEDRIRSIAHLGFIAYGWTFKVNGRPAPAPQPFLQLEAPSGAIWEFGEDNAQERIEGKAEEFCQVVTQVRNIADTSLRTTGPNATDWMAIAQCFAGPKETPPEPGVRATKRR